LNGALQPKENRKEYQSPYQRSNTNTPPEDIARNRAGTRVSTKQLCERVDEGKLFLVWIFI
jgi:hypothetical protein